jgi:serine/threonine-protein phosphatase 2B catalytic subunit
MLVAVLNTCTKEELEEPADGSEYSAGTDNEDSKNERAERRRIIRNKILAVGRVSRVFSVLRCVLNFRFTVVI